MPPKNSKTSKASFEAGPNPDRNIKAILRELQVPDDRWDLLLIGDGSGSNWNKGCGWCTIAIERAPSRRTLLTGATNLGTVNFAELMAYLHALTWYVAQLDSRTDADAGKAKIVHILTDSEYVAKTGGRRDHHTLNANRGLWMSLDWLERQGLLLHWHYIPRESIRLNSYADAGSKLCRLMMEVTDFPSEIATYPGGPGRDLKDCN